MTRDSNSEENSPGGPLAWILRTGLRGGSQCCFSNKYPDLSSFIVSSCLSRTSIPNFHFSLCFILLFISRLILHCSDVPSIQVSHDPFPSLF